MTLRASMGCTGFNLGASSFEFFNFIRNLEIADLHLQPLFFYLRRQPVLFSEFFLILIDSA